MALFEALVLLLSALSVAEPSPVQTEESLATDAGKRVNIGQPVPLPSISQLIDGDGNILSFQLGNCVLDLSKTKCQFTLKPSAVNCPSGLPLATILDHFLPNNKLEEISKSFLIPDKLKVEFITIDKCEGTLSFGCESTESLEVIPQTLSIDESKLTMEYNFRSANPAWDKLGLNIKGKATVGSKKVEASLLKKINERNVDIDLTVDEITISDFTALFSKSKSGNEGKTVAELANSEELDDKNSGSISGVLVQDSLSRLNECRKSLAKKRSDDEVVDPTLSTETLTGLTIEKPTFSGKFNPKESFEVTISGLPKASFFKGTVFATVDQKNNEKVRIAVVASIENFSPAQLLSKLTKKDLNNIPLLKDVTVNFAASVSNAKISGIKNEELASVLKAFGDNTDTIEQGVVLKIELPVKDVIEKINPGYGGDVPDSLYLKAKIGGGKVKLSFPETWQTDLLHILSALTPKAIELLPDWLRGKGPGKVEVKKLDFDYVEKIFSVRVTAAGPINIKNVLTLSNVDIDITHDYKKKNWDFKLESTQKLFEEVTLTVSVAKEGPNFKFSGSIDEITTSQIARWLQAEFVSDALMNEYSFLDFGVQDLQVQGKTGRENLYLRITGTATFAGWPGVSMEGILFRKQQRGTVLAVGLLLREVRLDQFIERVFKTQIQFVSWIGELNLAVAIMGARFPAEEEGFTLEGLKGTGLKGGLTLRAEFKTPSTCPDDICKQAKEIIGEKKIVLEATVGRNEARFTAAVSGDWKIGENVIITDISLVIDVLQEKKIYFSVTVKLVRPELEFEGSIGVGLQGNVELSGTMKGMWEKPFGLQYLSVGDVKLSVGLYVGVMLPTVELGARLVLGKIGNGKEIKVEGAIGIDPVTPTKNYFYAKVNQLTLEKISEAFEFSVNLPSILANTGFPEGLVVSFTMNPQGKLIENLNVEIPFGFAFKGTIQIDTYRVKCDIKLDFPSYYDIKVELDPLTLANGALKLYRSSRNKEQGPLLQGKVSTEEVKVHIVSYSYMLGIESEVDIKFDYQQLEFHVAGNLFGIIQATVDVKAKYASWAQLEFENTTSQGHPTVKSDIKEEKKTPVDTKPVELKKGAQSCTGPSLAKICIGSEVAEDIKTEFEKYKKEQTESLRAVKREAKTLLREVMTILKAYRKEKLERYAALRRCYSQIQNSTTTGPNEEAMTHHDCMVKCQDCHEASGKRSSCSKAERRLSKCSCRFDDACYAECKRTEIYSRIKTGIKRGFWSWLGSQIRKGFEAIGKGIKKGFDWVVDKVHKGLKWTMNQIKKILQLFINVKRACASGSLGSMAQKACVRFEIEVEILKIKTLSLDVDLCLDAGFVKKVAELIFGSAAGPIQECKQKLYDLRRWLKKLQVYKAEMATALKEGRLGEILGDDSTEQENVNTEEEASYEPEPYDIDRILEEDQNEAFSKHTSSENPQVPEPNHSRGYRMVTGRLMDKANLPVPEMKNRYASVTRNKDLVPGSPCRQLRRATKAYQVISDNLGTMVRQYETEKRQFEQTKEDEESFLKKRKSDFQGDSAHGRWSRAVEAHLKVQNKESMKIWRRSLDDIFTAYNGYGAAQHLADVDHLSHAATKRMRIPRRVADQHAESLAFISQGMRDLLLSKRDYTLEDTKEKLQQIEPHLSFMKTATDNCERKESF